MINVRDEDGDEEVFRTKASLRGGRECPRRKIQRQADKFGAVMSVMRTKARGCLCQEKHGKGSDGEVCVISPAPTRDRFKMANSTLGQVLSGILTDYQKA